MKCIDKMPWYKTSAGGESVCGASISKVSGQEQCILQIYSYSSYSSYSEAREGDDKRPDCGVIML